MSLLIAIIATIVSIYLDVLTLSVNLSYKDWKWSKVFGDKPVARKTRKSKTTSGDGLQI